MADARMQNEVESDLPQGEVRNESEMRQCARDKSVTVCQVLVVCLMARVIFIWTIAWICAVLTSARGGGCL